MPYLPLHKQKSKKGGVAHLSRYFTYAALGVAPTPEHLQHPLGLTLVRMSVRPIN